MCNTQERPNARFDRTDRGVRCRRPVGWPGSQPDHPTSTAPVPGAIAASGATDPRRSAGRRRLADATDTGSASTRDGATADHADASAAGPAARRPAGTLASRCPARRATAGRPGAAAGGPAAATPTGSPAAAGNSCPGSGSGTAAATGPGCRPCDTGHPTRIDATGTANHTRCSAARRACNDAGPPIAADTRSRTTSGAADSDFGALRGAANPAACQRRHGDHTAPGQRPATCDRSAAGSRTTAVAGRQPDAPDTAASHRPNAARDGPMHGRKQ